eukprot:235860-Chlamydomonas_euryale.AAC.3
MSLLEIDLSSAKKDPRHRLSKSKISHLEVAEVVQQKVFGLEVLQRQHHVCSKERRDCVAKRALYVQVVEELAARDPLLRGVRGWQLSGGGLGLW